MRVCIVAEGCYPYVVGGVSGWIHSMINAFPNVEFVLLTLIANRSQSGKFQYTLPENLTEVHEVYLDDEEWAGARKSGRKTHLNKEQYRALRSLVLNRSIDWETLFDLFKDEHFSVDDLLMGHDFLKIAVEFYEAEHGSVTFTDFLWTLRSIYLPLFTVLRSKIPQADVYHCVATGYAGILGCMGQYFHGGKLLLSEHGIYTREREEELIKAEWIANAYRGIWIQQFKKMSKAIYDRADTVTSLYEQARKMQIELGCPPSKTRVTPNGIVVERMENAPGKQEEDAGSINVGAVVRVAPIKDIKTMIQAFVLAKKRMPALKLWIMGPWEEEQAYAQECFALAEDQGAEGIIFTGRVDVTEYIGRMDMTLLTSISEGQPLTVLESYAAGKPVICTNVGCCRELIYGNDDGLGRAGILTHIMNVEEIAAAILELASSEELRRQMGENGRRRVKALYHIDGMRDAYRSIYRGFCEDAGKKWTEEVFKIER